MIDPLLEKRESAEARRDGTEPPEKNADRQRFVLNDGGGR